MEYLDYMVDLETTGTQPEHAGILQLAVVRFDYATGQVDSNMFNRPMHMAPSRLWDFQTINWWRQEKGRMDHLNWLMKNGQPPMQVLQELTSWIGNPSAPVRLWAKPTHFEFPFLSSYYSQFGLEIPFHYRYAMDVNSFIRGMQGQSDILRDEIDVPFEGQAHNALFDALHEVRVVLKAKELYGK